jgi:hypothetical protein
VSRENGAGGQGIYPKYVKELISLYHERSLKR